MLNLSKKTDYALLALSYLTRAQANRAVNTKEIAEQFDIPVELLAKILQQLAKAKLVISTAGPTGGYRLARPATDISVGAIIEVIDGSPAIVHCLRTSQNACSQLDKCTVRKPLARINARILQMLNLISLAEISEEDHENTAIPFLIQFEPRSRVLETPAGF